MSTLIKIITLLFILIMGWSVSFGQQPPNDTVQTSRKYVKVEIDGMACPFCSYGVIKKLKKIEGQQDLYIDVQKGYATFSIPADNKPTREKLNNIIEEAGFEARKITFSDQPFENTKKKNDSR